MGSESFEGFPDSASNLAPDPIAIKFLQPAKPGKIYNEFDSLTRKLSHAHLHFLQKLTRRSALFTLSEVQLSRIEIREAKIKNVGVLFISLLQVWLLRASRQGRSFLNGGSMPCEKFLPTLIVSPALSWPLPTKLSDAGKAFQMTRFTAYFSLRTFQSFIVLLKLSFDEGGWVVRQ